jgi:hypothetical protein
MENVDLVIVGAGRVCPSVYAVLLKQSIADTHSGWHGLVNAKTYLEVNPSAKVIIYDGAQSVGGVWAEERLYPGLKTNNMLGTYEYSDFPMTEERFGVKPGQHIPGQVIHDYLLQYAEVFGLLSRIRLRCKVQTAEMKETGQWELTTLSDGINDASPKESRIVADKLILATGLTSDPFMPRLEGSADFDAPLFHVKDFRNQANSKHDIKNIVVLGTSKSAWDACYAYATTGVQVHLIIRSSGIGPVWVAPPYVTPFKIWLESLILTRFLTWFSPSIWGDADGYGWIRGVLHGTWLGRKLVSGFWFVLGDDVVNLMGYDKHPETKKLKPWNHVFWIASGLAISNYDTEFFALVRDGKIKVHVGDITHLSQRMVHLSDGSSLPADSLICSTGWIQKPPVKFLPEGIDAELGLPHYSAKEPELANKADAVILSEFPRLQDQPSHNAKYKPLPSSTDLKSLQLPNQPYRLYRFTVPSSPALFRAHSIAFAGSYLSVSTVTIAQVQGLWITAYFGNDIPSLASKSSYADNKIEWNTILHSQFGKWRHPAAASGYWERFPDMAFDSLPFVDLLLTDLGLSSHRKGGWWWREWFVPYNQSDYKGLVAEWIEKVKGSKENSASPRGLEGAPEAKKYL